VLVANYIFQYIDIQACVISTYT